ncbi:mechanosensitive ion channel family protein [Massilia sp.]|uniref:mechanosensitive ion channel family protein n=1 Tax=Massilia sp. TaxID=1882437 RepID=UPI0028A68FD3|nr:mechanosensitive ion channel family protein [Massilia sp.]
MDFRAFVDSLDITLPNALFALALGVAAFAAIHGVLMLFRRRLDQLSDEWAHRPVAEVLRKTLARTSNLVVFATAVLIGLSALDLPPPWNARIGHLWFLTLGLQLAIYLHSAIKVTARRYFRSHNPAGVDSQVTIAHTLIIWVLQTTVWVIFALALLSNLGINVTTFVASLGIGGIAIALAVQNVLGDLFASLSIAIDKPFEVGDFVSTNNISGTVEKVGLKTTRIRALGGEQIVISNADLLKSTVSNFKRMETRRIVFNLRAHPDTPPALAAQVPPALKEIIGKRDKARFDRAHLSKFDQNFIEYEIVYTMLDASYDLFMDTQQAILLDAMRMLHELGISSAPRAQQLLLQEPAENAAPELPIEGRVRSPAALRSLPKGV